MNRAILSIATTLILLRLFTWPAYSDDKSDCYDANDNLNGQIVFDACRRMISRGPSAWANLSTYELVLWVVARGYEIRGQWSDAIKMYDNIVGMAKNDKTVARQIWQNQRPYLHQSYDYYQLGQFETAKERLDLHDSLCGTLIVFGCNGPEIPGLPGKISADGAELRGDIEAKSGAYSKAKSYYTARLEIVRKDEASHSEQVKFMEAIPPNDDRRSPTEVFNQNLESFRKAAQSEQRTIVSLNQKIDKVQNLIDHPTGAPPPTPAPSGEACKMFPNLC